MPATNLRFPFLLLLFLFAASLPAQTEGEDRALDSARVTARRITTALRPAQGGAWRWDLRMMDELPKFLGNADPLHYTQLLPGVQTTSEYDAGLHVQGCDNGHNVVSLGGVRIYNPAHLLGFFSVFNASHFPAMQFSLRPVAASGNHLGGALQMVLPEDLPSRATGELTVGPLSSQGTLRLPLGSRSAVFVSARQAYLNLLYGHWLDVDGSAMEYGFGDYNLTVVHRAGERDVLTADAYFGKDRVAMEEEDWQMHNRLEWRNCEAALHWKHLGKGWLLAQTLFATDYRNDFGLEGAGVSFSLPSSVTDYGYRASWESGGLTAEVQGTAHRLRPQSPEVQSDYIANHPRQPLQRAAEVRLSAAYTFSPLPRLRATAGLAASLFRPAGGSSFAALDPSLRLVVPLAEQGALRLDYAVLHQYLHQSGFSATGLPTEYWFASGGGRAPQWAHSFAAAWETSFAARRYRLSVEAYCKLLRHQTEYVGNVFDFLTERYDPSRYLIEGRGENYGLNLMLHKRTGRLTGWVSYAVGRAMRRFSHPGYPGRYPSAHERIHELNAVATCRLGRRWSLGGTFVAASGTPFTAPEEFYLVNGYPVARFGSHNSRRLSPYCRLDLSANFALRSTPRRESGFNLSLYNCTGRRNELFRRLSYRDGTVFLRPVSFAVRVLPSVSFYCKFK